MKNLSKKLLLSILSIALVVIALGTSTFAWFTLSNQASVGEFNVEVTAGEGMELSLDGTTWYSAIPADVMQAKVKTLFGTNINGENPVLNIVTSKDLTLFQKLSINNTLVNATANADYLSIVIHVRAIGLNDIYVTTVGLAGTDFDWTPDISFLGAKQNLITPTNILVTNPADAARVGIVPVGEATPVTFPFAFQNPMSTTNTVLESTIPTSVDGGQAAYYFAKNGIEVITPKTVFEAVTTIDQTLATGGVKILALTTGAVGETYNTGKFNLLVWYEGCDPDTYNSISGKPVRISLSFEGRKVTP